MKTQKVKVYATIGLAIIFFSICIFSMISDSRLPINKVTGKNKHTKKTKYYSFNKLFSF